jgi:hypothetical protein
LLFLYVAKKKSSKKVCSWRTIGYSTQLINIFVNGFEEYPMRFFICIRTPLYRSIAGSQVEMIGM